MASLRIATALFAIFSLTAAKNECFVEHSAALAASSNCGDMEALVYCLSQLQSQNEDDVVTCYQNAGCDLKEAEAEAEITLRNCREMSLIKELRKRASASSTAETEASSAASSAAASSSAEASSTAASSAASSSSSSSSSSSASSSSTSSATASTIASSSIASSTATESTVTSSSSTSSTSSSSSSTSSTTSYSSGAVMSGTICFHTTNTSTSACSVTTSNGHTITGSCTPTEVATSSCSANFICTTNTSGDICMEAQSIQTGGIIIAIIFAGLIVVLVGGVCIAGVRDSKKQKRLAAKAEDRRPLMGKKVPV